MGETSKSPVNVAKQVEGQFWKSGGNMTVEELYDLWPYRRN